MARNSIDVAARPEPEAELEYELGLGPLNAADHTGVVEADASRTLVPRAEFRHAGAVLIHLELEPPGAERGAALQLRNDVALGRLRALAETRR